MRGIIHRKKKQALVNEKLSLESSQPETYDQLLPKLSPVMRKMCLSRKAQEEKSKKDEWFSSLQYLNASINDLPISESFLDNGSEFDGFNLATIEALGWKVDKPSKFAVKGISDPTKNQFRIEDHGKTYIIPTFSKAPIVKDPPKEEQESSSQVSTNSFNLSSKEDLKKSVKSLKSAS